MGFIRRCWESCEDTFGKSWQPAEFSDDGEKANVRVFLKKGKKDPEYYKLLSLTFQSLERLWSRSFGKLFPGTQRTREWFGQQQIFTKVKSCSTHLFFLYDAMIVSVDKGRAAGVDFRKTFDTVSLHCGDQMGQILTRWVRYWLQKWTVRWAKVWLDLWVQRFVKSSTNGVPLG